MLLIRLLNVLAACGFLFTFLSFVASPVHGQQMVLEQEKVFEEAAKRNWPIRMETPDGRTMGLRAMYRGMPLYYITHNSEAARSTNAYPLYLGGAAGLDLAGEGVTLGVWDESMVRVDHVEFGDRAVQMDAAEFLSAHATHVAGTMAASGVHRFARGMSYQANLECFDWFDDTIEMDDAAKNRDLRVSNHSYGIPVGWTIRVIFPSFMCEEEPPLAQPVVWWVWLGDEDIDPFEDYFFGYYSPLAREWEIVSHDNPHYLWVKSAGNTRNSGPEPGTIHFVFDFDDSCYRFSTAIRSKDGINGFDCLAHNTNAKNGLVVGAVHGLPNGYQGPASVVMSSFSSWGPTDDGRIKPDIVGKGVDVFSSIEIHTQAYGSLSGTSMSAPNVSGSIGLLLQHWRNTHPGMPDMLSSTVRGLLIHTADESGDAPGPDYRFGWGLMNTRRAAELITLDQSMPLTISEHVLMQGQVFELFVVSDPASSELKATLCWLDPPPQSLPPVALNPRDRMLVNDLDLRIIGPTTTFLPWVLDVENPSFPATKGDNIVDNVEQVIVPTPVSNAYRLRVTHKGVLSGGPQTFSLIISGAKSIRSEPESIAPKLAESTPASGANVGKFSTVRVVFDEPVFGVLPGHLRVNGSPAAFVGGTGVGPYLFSGFDQPSDGNVVIQVAGGTIHDMFGNLFTGANWSALQADCNNNGVFDAEDISSGTSIDCNLSGIPDECDPDVLRLTISPGEVIPYPQLREDGAAALISGGVAPISIRWTFKTAEGGENFEGASPAFLPKEPGDYETRLNVNDAAGCAEGAIFVVRVFQADLDAIGSPLPGGFFCPFMGLFATAVALAGVITLRVRRKRGR